MLLFDLVASCCCTAVTVAVTAGARRRCFQMMNPRCHVIEILWEIWYYDGKSGGVCERMLFQSSCSFTFSFQPDFFSINSVWHLHYILIQLAHVYFNNLQYNFTVLFGTFLFAIIVPLWDFSFPFRSLFGASCLLATTFECSTWPSFLKSSGFNVDSWASLFL